MTKEQSKEMTNQEKTQLAANLDFANFLQYAPEELEEADKADGQQIDALEIAIGKEFDGTKTFMILLGTGGPAMRIIGELDEHSEPITAKYQYQDWFTEWTTAEGSENNKIVLQYARQFYFDGME